MIGDVYFYQYHDSTFYKEHSVSESSSAIKEAVSRRSKYLKWFEECFFHCQSAIFSEKLHRSTKTKAYKNCFYNYLCMVF